MKLGITDPGGGLRGIYTVGIYDYCLDHNISFDLGIGVSAGAANLVAFMTGVRQRNLRMYTEYAHRKEFMGINNLIKQHSYVNLDYIYNQLNNIHSENPLDFDAFNKHPMELQIVATDAHHGLPVYLDRSLIHPEKLDALMASASIPVVCPAFPIGPNRYYDGAVSDPIPVQRAFDSGCDKVIVLLTMPREFRRVLAADYPLITALHTSYPKMSHALKRRFMIYNRSLALAKKYEAEGKAIIIAPKNFHNVGVLSGSKEDLLNLYKEGYQDGAKITAFLEANS